METIDLTPTWASIIDTLIIAAQNNSASAIDELKRLASIADRFVHVSKNETAYSDSAIKCADYLADKKELTDFEEWIEQGSAPNEHIYWHAMNVLNRLDQLPTK